MTLLLGDLVTLGVQDSVDHRMTDLVGDLVALGHLDVLGHLDGNLGADRLLLLDAAGVGCVETIAV